MKSLLFVLTLLLWRQVVSPYGVLAAQTKDSVIAEMLTNRPPFSTFLFTRHFPNQSLPGNKGGVASIFDAKVDGTNFILRQLSSFEERNSTNQTAALLCGQAGRLMWKYSNGSLQNYTIPESGPEEGTALLTEVELARRILDGAIKLGVTAVVGNFERTSLREFHGTDFREAP